MAKLSGAGRLLPLLLALACWPMLGRAEERPVTEGEYSARVDLDEYQAAGGGSAPHQVDAPLMVSLAYGLMWILVLFFVSLAWRRAQALAAELRSAKERLALLERRTEGDPPFPAEEQGSLSDEVDGPGDPGRLP